MPDLERQLRPWRRVARLRDAGTEVFVVDAPTGDAYGTPGLDSEESLAQLDVDYTGGIWTNRIELLGPLLERRSDARRRSLVGASSCIT